MNTCSEFVLDDVAAIAALPLSAVASAPSSPVISSSGFLPVMDERVIVIGSVKATKVENGIRVSVGSVIPVIAKSAKAKDSESLAVAGRSHTVTVQCEVDDRASGAWGLLRTLEEEPRHLLLTMRDGTQAFVRSTQDTYQCSVSRGDGRTSVSFRVHCRAGMQLID